MALATLPSKQGLKLRMRDHRWRRNLSLATLPSKQGLKPDKCHRLEKEKADSRYTSIKTRIETRSYRTGPPAWSHTLATLPSKQGLKPQYYATVEGAPLALATLPSKQGLKRITIRARGYQPRPLATLPSKQGLKRLPCVVCVARFELLSLHFHQNKD